MEEIAQKWKPLIISTAGFEVETMLSYHLDKLINFRDLYV